MKTIAEIKERMAAINEEIKRDDSDLDALKAELDTLINEKRALEMEAAREQQRSEIAQALTDNAVKEVVVTKPGNVAKRGTVEYRSSDEYRTAFRTYVTAKLKSKEYHDALAVLETPETRAADQIESVDLGVMLPETIVNKIMTEIGDTYGNIYTRVKKTNYRGGVKYPIASFSATYKRITETTVSERQAAGGVTGYIQFGYNIGEIRIANTLLQSLLTNEAFESEVAKVIVEKFLEKMDTEIMLGDSTKNELEGILTEYKKTSGSRIKASHVLELSEKDIAEWTEWYKKIFAPVPGKFEGSHPEFLFTRRTFIKNIATMKDENGQPIFKSGFNNTWKDRQIGGVPVICIENNLLPDFDEAEVGDIVGLFWVPGKAYAINDNLGFSVRSYFDEETNQRVQKAIFVNDGKILDPEYLYLIKKVAATA